MLRLIVRILLTAVLFSFVFPKIASGVQFHGQFWPDSIISAIVFAMVSYLVGVLITLSATFLSVLTFGLTVLVFVLGFWLIPAIQLQAFAHYFPEQLTIASWGSAIWGGLLLMVVNIMTASLRSKS